MRPIRAAEFYSPEDLEKLKKTVFELKTSHMRSPEIADTLNSMGIAHFSKGAWTGSKVNDFCRYNVPGLPRMRAESKSNLRKSERTTHLKTLKAKDCARIRELSESGKKYDEIAKILNKEGFVNSRGTEITKGALSQLMRSRKYFAKFKNTRGGSKRRRRQAPATTAAVPKTAMAKTSSKYYDTYELLELLFASNIPEDRRRVAVAAIAGDLSLNAAGKTKG